VDSGKLGGVNIVLVHGLAGSSRWWRAVVPDLEARHRVEVLDLPRGDPLDAVAPRIDGAVLVGHSLGGLVCVRAALRHPERVRALVLVAPVGVPLARSLTQNLTPLVRAVVAAPTVLVPLLVRDALRMGPFALARGAATAVGADVRAELSSLHLPTLLVWGSRDPLVPAELAEEWHRALPDARLAVLEGVAHAPMLECPHELARELLDFLEEVENEAA
jgi:pimeloyl-ACP methyl ester carboxylesterase